MSGSARFAFLSDFRAALRATAVPIHVPEARLSFAHRERPRPSKIQLPPGPSNALQVFQALTTELLTNHVPRAERSRREMQKSSLRVLRVVIHAFLASFSRLGWPVPS